MTEYISKTSSTPCGMVCIDTGDSLEVEQIIWQCESCCYEFTLVNYDEDGWTWVDEPPRHCPNCGRKVIS